MAIYYSRWIEVYQNVPNLDNSTCQWADQIANKFDKELRDFVDTFNLKNNLTGGDQMDVGDFDTKFTEVDDGDEE